VRRDPPAIAVHQRAERNRRAYRDPGALRAARRASDADRDGRPAARQDRRGDRHGAQQPGPGRGLASDCVRADQPGIRARARIEEHERRKARIAESARRAGERDTWALFAAAALQGSHAASSLGTELAARRADELLEQWRQRFAERGA